MALPATDTFTRDDGALGANWTGSVGSDLQIISNTVTGQSSSDASMYWSADAPDAAQYAQVVFVSGTADYCGPVARASATDYVVLGLAISAPTQLEIQWYNGGSWTVIGTAYEVAPTAGRTYRIEANGTTFTGYENGTSRTSGSNGDAPATGGGGLYVYSNGIRLDDFEVGNLAPPPAPTTAFWSWW